MTSYIIDHGISIVVSLHGELYIFSMYDAIQGDRKAL